MNNSKLTSQALKSAVEKKYTELAEQKEKVSCGCGSNCCSDAKTEVASMDLDYSGEQGYAPEADLKLGCGIPTRHAGLETGQTVLDLGSGAGLDAFVARSIVGETGRVIGVDMTLAMVEKARANVQKLGYENVEFRLGEIENMPVTSNSIDVALSNCVLNLVPDKKQAFEEMYRVLKPGAHFCVSDIVTKGHLPEKLKNVAELYAGCVSGAMPIEEYLAELEKAGFENVAVLEERKLDLPNDLVNYYLDENEVEQLRKSGAALYSVTVRGDK